MLSFQQWFASGEPAMADDVGRKVTIVHAVGIAVITVLALAAFLTIDGMVRVHQASATAIGLTDRQRMLSQRIANLTAQYALGTIGARSELGATIADLETTHWSAMARDTSAGLRSAGADPVSDDIAQARRIAAMPARNPALAADAAPAFLAAQPRLLDAFNRDLQVSAERVNWQLATLRVVGAALCALMAVTLSVPFIAVFRPMAQRIVQLIADASELAHHATVDPLTGMLNKRSFQARGAIEINKARRYGRPLSLLMIDADQLSAIEDEHGSDGGATVLRALTSSFFGATRVSDLVAHVDAEQFAILLPETSCEGAELLAERLRHKISDLTMEINRMPVTCTISVGVAAAEKDASFLWPTFKRADEALYEAKMRGRNRVVVATAA